MELTLWTYEGPPHVGAIRVAASMRDVHLMLQAADVGCRGPPGDMPRPRVVRGSRSVGD